RGVPRGRPGRGSTDRRRDRPEDRGPHRRRVQVTPSARAPSAGRSSRRGSRRRHQREARQEGRVSERVLMSLRVNQQRYEVAAPPHHTLLEVLREECGLTGTKHGCELGECGACTVLLDGAPVYSCLTLALEVEGREVTTVEGLARGAELDPLQTAF